MSWNCKHCVVHLRVRDGQIQRGCPHCWKVLSKVPALDEELARRQVKSTIDSHAELCSIPVRWGNAAAPSTPVQSARSAPSSRLRYARR